MLLKKKQKQTKKHLELLKEYEKCTLDQNVRWSYNIPGSVRLWKIERFVMHTFSVNTSNEMEVREKVWRVVQTIFILWSSI